MTELYEPAPGWDQPAAGRCRTGMTRLREFLVAEFDGDNLGCYVNRPKTGGSSTSLHRDGRAIDIGFADLDKRDEAYEFLIKYATPLRVQMVLNYVSGNRGGVRWRLPYSLTDTAAGRGSFSSVGHWLHIERTNAGADDARTIAELIAPLPPPKDPDMASPFYFTTRPVPAPLWCVEDGELGKYAIHLPPEEWSRRGTPPYKQLDPATARRRYTPCVPIGIDVGFG